MTLDDAISGLNTALMQARQTNSGACNVLSYFVRFVQPQLPGPPQDPPEQNPAIDAAILTFCQQLGDMLGVGGQVQNEVLCRHEDLVYGVFEEQGFDGMVIYSDRVGIGAIDLAVATSETKCKLFTLPSNAPTAATNSPRINAIRSFASQMRRVQP